MKHGILIRSFAATLLTLGVFAGPAYADSDPDIWDAEAIEVLKQMNVYMNSLEKFVVLIVPWLLRDHGNCFVGRVNNVLVIRVNEIAKDSCRLLWANTGYRVYAGKEQVLFGFR